MCNGSKASPYEHEEILFLSSVAGLVRQNPSLVNLFIQSHRCDYLISAKLHRSNSVPVKNSLFDNDKIEASIRRISIVVDNYTEIEDENSVSSRSDSIEQTGECSIKQTNTFNKSPCDCEEYDRFPLLDTITGYLDSAVNLFYTFLGISNKK